MSGPLEDGIKRWTAKRKSALVIEIIQGKTTVAERAEPLSPSRRRKCIDHVRQELGGKSIGRHWSEDKGRVTNTQGRHS